MKAAILSMLGSKKFLAMLSAIIVYVVGRFGIDMDASKLDPIWQIIMVYVGAQAIADHGKTAAEIHTAKGGAP